MSDGQTSKPTAVSAYKTVGDLRRQYGANFAEGYEDTDQISAVLGRAGMATLGEYLKLHQPVST